MDTARKVKDVMTREVETARPDMTVREAAEKMKARNIGSLPVCEGNRLVGILTDRDITVRVTAEGKNPSETRVADIMTREPLHTVSEDASLEEAERIMHDQQIRRLPVINAEGALVGYLSQAKVVRVESPSRAGKLLKGISRPEKPQPMESYARRSRRKTG
jgi:CBS domain-containing protein